MASGAGSSASPKNLEDFKMWSVQSLKAYIKARGYSSVGNKETLSALAFGLHTVNAPVKKTELELTHDKSLTYKSLLVVGDVSLPDPLLLEHDWINENDGMKYWPGSMYWDICKFFGFHQTTHLTDRLMKDYKEGKGYSYFTSGKTLFGMNF